LLLLLKKTEMAMVPQESREPPISAKRVVALFRSSLIVSIGKLFVIFLPATSGYLAHLSLPSNQEPGDERSRRKTGALIDYRE
jgi:hypothetical protein